MPSIPWNDTLTASFACTMPGWDCKKDARAFGGWNNYNLELDWNLFFPGDFPVNNWNHFRNFVNPEAPGLHMFTCLNTIWSSFDLCHKDDFQHIFRPTLTNNISYLFAHRFHRSSFHLSLIFPSWFFHCPFMFPSFFSFPRHFLSCFIQVSFIDPSCSFHFAFVFPSFSLHLSSFPSFVFHFPFILLVLSMGGTGVCWDYYS